jgi:hypothetical protein
MLDPDFLLGFHCNFMSNGYRFGVIGPVDLSGNDVIAISAARRRVGVPRTTDSERSIPTSYQCSIVTFRLFRTVFKLLMIPFQREICIMGLKFRGFWVATPPTSSVDRLDPLKALFYIRAHVLSPQRWKAVQWFGLSVNLRKLL